jgi:hypothetical protein
MSGERPTGGEGRGATAVQAGKALCVSETIFPAASRHVLRLVYRGFGDGGALQPGPQARLEGGEFVDLRGSGAARPGASR